MFSWKVVVVVFACAGKFAVGSGSPNPGGDAVQDNARTAGKGVTFKVLPRETGSGSQQPISHSEMSADELTSFEAGRVAHVVQVVARVAAQVIPWSSPPTRVYRTAGI